MILFPRWTGPKGHPPILMGKTSLVKYIRINNGIKQCVVSVYAFDKFRNAKPYIQSAIIDRLYCRGKPDKIMEYLRDLDLSNIFYNAYYDGKEILLMVPLGKIVPDLKIEILRLGSKTINIPFSTRTWDLMLWPRTWNPKSKKYIIEVMGTDNIDELSNMADAPIKRLKRSGKLIGKE